MGGMRTIPVCNRVSLMPTSNVLRQPYSLKRVLWLHRLTRSLVAPGYKSVSNCPTKTEVVKTEYSTEAVAVKRGRVL